MRLLREGDTLKVTRLSRSVLHLVTLGAELRERGIGLHVIEQGIDTATMEGRAMFGMLSVLAELQRELIVANTNDGLASAGRGDGSAGAGRSSPRTRPRSPNGSTTSGRRPSSRWPTPAASHGPPCTGTSTRPGPCLASRRRPRSRSPESYRRVPCSLVSGLGLRGRAGGSGTTGGGSGGRSGTVPQNPNSGPTPPSAPPRPSPTPEWSSGAWQPGDPVETTAPVITPGQG
ncbi:recombinase family protein [Streptomyces sp. 12257]|nr:MULTISPECIES: recombinase family protein [Streptomyces]MDI5904081.1 recombinase family protein [Streptomyces sp. 12257]